MSEQKRMKKQLYKNMFYIYIVFIILFLLFDVIIYNKISTSIYKSIDEQLNNEISRYSNGSIKEFKEPRELPEKEYPPIEDENVKNREDMLFKDINPRLVCIIRNENGEVINKNNIGRTYENYFQEIEFDSKNVNNTYMVKIADEYNYRGVTIARYNENNQLEYIQFLANVDGEIQTLDNVSFILIVGTAVIIAISIFASYILSRRALNPIMVSWKKQTEFVQNASHELRTPLTIIQAKQELLLQEPNKKIIDKSEDINISLTETKRLSKLVKDLMILARADSNEVMLEKNNINIDNVIKNILSPYIEFAELEGKEVIMNLQYGKDILLDESKISQLIVILLDNAIKYTTKGDTITINTYSKEGKFNLEVADTGIGMSNEGIKHAFDRFYREDKARSREKGGSGLGLAIAYMITQLHGGSIRIMHNQPKGTKINVKIKENAYGK